MKRSLICALFLLNGPIFAGEMGPIEDFHWVGAFSIGPVWERGGVGQTIFLTPSFEKYYTANKSTNRLADGELFLGFQKNLPYYELVGQFGITGALTSQAGLSGDIWDDGVKLFDNYVYGYKVQHSHVGLKAKILKDYNYFVMPWISGSIGVAFNNAHGFYNYATNTAAVPQNNFINNTQTSFTYTVGAGIQKALTPNFQVGAGYEFSDWGKSQLGPCAGQISGTGLTVNHIYTNGLMFNLSYIV